MPFHATEVLSNEAGVLLCEPARIPVPTRPADHFVHDIDYVWDLDDEFCLTIRCIYLAGARPDHLLLYCPRLHETRDEAEKCTFESYLSRVVLVYGVGRGCDNRTDGSRFDAV